ncbi:Fic/DOC family protein [Streptomyces sp. NPDC101166]|uniref:Fic/DOC family protein n=1 Tax=Streptomyces sp. NPDC101166 TaxID=3366120 RepID=UPI0037FDE6BA
MQRRRTSPGRASSCSPNAPLPGAYDLGHLQAFHAAIFGDIHPWAGELRTVNIAKRTPFCPARNLVSYAGEVFGRLASSGHLRDLPRQEFVVRLAELYGDMNVLHPFREGNGRAQRAFLAQLSTAAGYDLNWSGMDPQRNEDASVKSFLGDNSLLEQYSTSSSPPRGDASVSRPAGAAPVVWHVSGRNGVRRSQKRGTPRTPCTVSSVWLSRSCASNRSAVVCCSTSVSATFAYCGELDGGHVDREPINSSGASAGALARGDPSGDECLVRVIFVTHGRVRRAHYAAR